VGIVAWLIGGFIAGLISEDIKEVLVTALLSLILSIFISLLIDNQIFVSLGLNTTVIMLDLITSLGLVFITAVSGLLMKRRVSK